MAQLLSIEEIPLGDSRLREFERFAWDLYRDDPHWAPPLRGDLLGNRILGLTGLLTPKHPYHEHAEVTHFLARRKGNIVGRISAAVNRRFNEYYNARIGFFGFFEGVEDYEVAKKLLDCAGAWLEARGMTVMRGPGEYSNATHERQGILIEGFDSHPTVDLTHNPPYYADFLERYGFAKAKDYYAYIMDAQNPAPERLTKLAGQVKKRRDIKTRRLSMINLRADVDLIVEIYNDSWARNWGFLPITRGEANSMADSLKLVADPGLIRFAFVRGEPAAVLGALPDPNVLLRPRRRWHGDSDFVRVARLLLKRRHIPLVRLMFFGVRPGFRNLGVDAILFNEVKDYATRHGYQQCETSMLLEDNHLIISPSEFMTAHRYKTWRIYDIPIGTCAAPLKDTGIETCAPLPV